MYIFHDKNKDVEELEFKKVMLSELTEKMILALIQVKSISKNIVPIEIAKSLPRVGEDAHAVGHPDNEFWTYTRGYVSQVRKNTNGIMMMNSTYRLLFKHKPH